MTTTPTQAPEAQGPVNPIGRMFGALFSPKAAFEDIARRPSWIAPMALFCILGLGFAWVMNQRVDWEGFIRQQAEKSTRFAQLSEQQKQRALEPQTKYAPMFAYAIGLLGSPVLVLILAGVYLGAFNLFAGAGLRFGQSFGITTHALMPSVIASLLGIVTMLLKSRGDVDPERLLASNVAALLPGDAPRWQVSLGSSLDIFWIWVLVLLGVGFAAANPKKISAGKGIGIVFGIWVVWVLVKVGWAAAFS
jgi:hypothetical protein